jgi:hypothetical protein
VRRQPEKSSYPTLTNMIRFLNTIEVKEAFEHEQYIILSLQLKWNDLK